MGGMCGLASMRPAHQAREVSGNAFDGVAMGNSFNEARASSAGSNWRRPEAHRHSGRFNEARASSAGSKAPAWAGPSPTNGFNEARASSAGSKGCHSIIIVDGGWLQ